MEAYETQKSTHGFNTDLADSLSGQDLFPSSCQLLSGPLTAPCKCPSCGCQWGTVSCTCVGVHATGWGVRGLSREAAMPMQQLNLTVQCFCKQAFNPKCTSRMDLKTIYFSMFLWCALWRARDIIIQIHFRMQATRKIEIGMQCSHSLATPLLVKTVGQDCSLTWAYPHSMTHECMSKLPPLN